MLSGVLTTNCWNSLACTCLKVEDRFEPSSRMRVRLFRSKNLNALAVFGQKLAARQKEKLRLTSFQLKGRQKEETWGN